MNSNKSFNFLIGIIIAITVFEISLFFIIDEKQYEYDFYDSTNAYEYDEEDSPEMFNSSNDSNLDNYNLDNYNEEIEYENSKTDNSYEVFNQDIATGDPYFVFDRVDEIMTVEFKGSTDKELEDFFQLELTALDNTYLAFLELVTESDTVKNDYFNEFRSARENYAENNQIEGTETVININYLLDEIFFTLNDLSRNVEIQTGGPLDLEKYSVEIFDTSKYIRSSIPPIYFPEFEE